MTSTGAGPDPGLLGAIATAAAESGAAAWLVGGSVRDLLLGLPARDVDAAIEGTAEAARRATSTLETGAGWRCRARHALFGTATLEGPDGTRVDVAVTREETYPRPGALPIVSPGVPIVRDLARRDFTIHAMAFSLGPAGVHGCLLDPFGGRADLDGKSVRLLHAGSLADDPTRVFRAARYAARLGFGLEPGFVAAMDRAVTEGAFERISGERLRRALDELLAEENRTVAIGILERLGVFAAVVGGWGVDDSAARAVASSAGTSDVWARLLAPVPASTRLRVAERLRFPRALRREAGCVP